MSNGGHTNHLITYQWQKVQNVKENVIEVKCLDSISEGNGWSRYQSCCEHLHWWNVLNGGGGRRGEGCCVKEGGTCILVVLAIKDFPFSAWFWPKMWPRDFINFFLWFFIIFRKSFQWHLLLCKVLKLNDFYHTEITWMQLSTNVTC